MQKLSSLLSQRKVILICLVTAALLSSAGAAAYIGVQQQIAKEKLKTADTAIEQSSSDASKPTANSGTKKSDPASPDDASTAPTNPSSTPAPSTPGTAPTPQSSANNTPKGSSGSSTPAPSTGNGTTAPTPKPQCPAGYVGTYPNCTVPAPSPLGIAGNWRLVMQDEFNGTSLNTAMWATQRGVAGGSYGDPYNPQYEDAFYVANNPKVTGGNLVFTLNKGATNGYQYSSGMVQNGRAFSYTYGYVESRIKVPGNTGVWPAFWTLAAPIDKYWPPEIDIFEFGLDGQTQPSFNYHYGSYPNNQQFGLRKYGSSSINYSQDFHTYGMLWTRDKIQVFLDGQPGPSYTVSANITSLPQYIILNLGLKKGANVPSGTAMLVDYVRVWQ